MKQPSFGYWLRLKRKALDLTRGELAARVGYSAATIRKVEDEERHPSAQVVERLAEIFDIPQTERASFLRFARGNPEFAPAETKQQFPWQTSSQSSPSNLPATTTSLIGREKEIANIREYLSKAEIRLVTLIGPPGIGKTRLSIEAARAALTDFPDGVFFVALAPLSDPSLIPKMVAGSLGYVQASDLPIEEQLKDGIGDKRMLILLDNCEHMIETAASLVSALLSACSHLKILATSRESFRIGGEWLYPVSAFDLPEKISSLTLEEASSYPALRLFAERARAVQPDFRLNSENIKTVSAICLYLDGLPLVIELIAARMRLMSPQALLERLSGQFILSADGMRATSERQKTLHNAIHWSYELLSPEEQKLFAYLTVFSGSFALGDAEAMLSRKFTEKPLPALIALLLDKSLLKLASNLEENAAVRYTMLVTIQEFARERLQERGEEIEIRNLHLAYFLELAEKADKELHGHNQLEWLTRLNADRENLRAALDWAVETGQTKAALQMARRLHWYWIILGDHNEGRQWLERVLGMPEAPFFPDAYAEVLTQLARHLFLLNRHFIPLAEQALSIARAHEDKHNVARALVMLGLALAFDDVAAAQSALEQSQALFREVHDEWGYANAVMCLAWTFFIQGNLESNLPLNGQALALFRKLGDRHSVSITFRGMANAHLKQNNLASAVAELREALIAAHELKSKYEIAATLSVWGEAEKQLQNHVRSVHLFWASRNILDSIGAWNEREAFQFETDIAPCRAALSESAFAKAIEESQTMTIEQVVAYALEKSND